MRSINDLLQNFVNTTTNLNISSEKNSSDTAEQLEAEKSLIELQHKTGQINDYLPARKGPANNKEEVVEVDSNKVYITAEQLVQHFSPALRKFAIDLAAKTMHQLQPQGASLTTTDAQLLQIFFEHLNKLAPHVALSAVTGYVVFNTYLKAAQANPDKMQWATIARTTIMPYQRTNQCLASAPESSNTAPPQNKHVVPEAVVTTQAQEVVFQSERAKELRHKLELLKQRNIHKQEKLQNLDKLPLTHRQKRGPKKTKIKTLFQRIIKKIAVFQSGQSQDIEEQLRFLKSKLKLCNYLINSGKMPQSSRTTCHAHITGKINTLRWHQYCKENPDAWKEKELWNEIYELLPKSKSKDNVEENYKPSHWQYPMFKTLAESWSIAQIRLVRSSVGKHKDAYKNKIQSRWLLLVAIVYLVQLDFSIRGGIKIIAEISGLTADNVRSHVKEMEEDGFLKCEWAKSRINGKYMLKSIVATPELLKILGWSPDRWRKSLQNRQDENPELADFVKKIKDLNKLSEWTLKKLVDKQQTFRAHQAIDEFAQIKSAIAKNPAASKISIKNIIIKKVQDYIARKKDALKKIAFVDAVIQVLRSERLIIYHPVLYQT